MKRYLPLLLVAFVFLSGCAVKNGGAPTPEQVEATRDQLNELSSSKTVSIAEHPYLGAKPIVRQTDGEDIPVLNASVTLKQKGTRPRSAPSPHYRPKSPIPMPTIPSRQNSHLLRSCRPLTIWACRLWPCPG